MLQELAKNAKVAVKIAKNIQFHRRNLICVCEKWAFSRCGE
jgi:hypothetical protein